MEAGWQLTRRGRFVFFGLAPLTVVLTLFLLVGSLLGPGVAQANSAQEGEAASTIVVAKSGQTLWDIAYASAPEQDTRDVVYELMRINDLETSRIVGGQQLEVPVYAPK